MVCVVPSKVLTARPNTCHCLLAIRPSLLICMWSFGILHWQSLQIHMCWVFVIPQACFIPGRINYLKANKWFSWHKTDTSSHQIYFWISPIPCKWCCFNYSSTQIHRHALFENIQILLFFPKQFGKQTPGIRILPFLQCKYYILCNHHGTLWRLYGMNWLERDKPKSNSKWVWIKHFCTER